MVQFLASDTPRPVGRGFLDRLQMVILEGSEDSSAPADIQRLFAFGDKQLAVLNGECSLCQPDTLPWIPLFEFRVCSSASPEVFKGFLLVSECLLQDNTGNICQKWKFFLERKTGKTGGKTGEKQDIHK